ncbi:MAG: 30S ribosomal protein S3, partial [Chloroflexi bacterium]|nr:30S ribosomal protein S3 [Chloroflexota bacterium]
MGHKVHPIGFRIGVIRDWQAKWYADKHYAEYLQEDMKLRQAIQTRYADAAVSLVEIERESNQVSIAIHTARPGIVIGRGGQRVDETKRYLEGLIGKKLQLNIQEIQQPELDAYLVARAVAEQIERRVAYRRAMNQAMLRTMQAGARGMKISCAGRLGGAEIARRLNMHNGQVPLHTLRANIDYGFIEARTVMGRIGIKVWIYKGEVLPESKVAEIAAESLAEVSTEAAPAVEPAEEPTKPAVRRRARAVPSPEARVAEIAAESLAEVSAEATPAVEPAEKPAKPAVRRRARAVPSPEARVAE